MSPKIRESPLHHTVNEILWLISLEQIINSEANSLQRLVGDVVFMPIPFSEERKISIFTFQFNERNVADGDMYLKERKGIWF